MELKHERPEWVKNFKCEKNTEIKYINGRWYLYERSTRYDPVLKRSRKVSGKMLGSITENGFVPKKERGEKKQAPAVENVEEKKIDVPDSRPKKESVQKPSSEEPTRKDFREDMAIAGVSLLLEVDNKELASLLERYFPSIWRKLYVLAVLRLECDDVSMFEERYASSMLSRLHPGLDLSPISIEAVSDKLSSNTGVIAAFLSDLKGNVGLPATCFMSMDDHVIAPIIDIDEVVPSLKGFIPFSAPDVPALLDQMLYSPYCPDDLLIAVRKEDLSKDDLRRLEASGRDYILKLKNDGKLAGELMPSSDDLYKDSFDARGRCILHSSFPFDGYDVHIFKDMEKRNDERSHGRRRNVFDGVSVFRTNRRNMNARQLYELFMAKDEVVDFIGNFLERKERLTASYGTHLSLFIEMLTMYLGQRLMIIADSLEGVSPEVLIKLSSLVICHGSGKAWSLAGSVGRIDEIRNLMEKGLPR